MKGDFTRITFDPSNAFSRVLMQQGRVQLDADWNELNAILLHYMRSLAADLIGPHGAPGNPEDRDLNRQFAIQIVSSVDQIDRFEDIEGLTIGWGHYYVDGFLCENQGEEEGGERKAISYYDDQPYYLLDKTKDSDALPEAPFLVYLDVWERHISYVQDDGIREVALGGPDTASRAQVVWQVKHINVKKGINSAIDELEQELEEAREAGQQERADKLDERINNLKQKRDWLMGEEEDVESLTCGPLLKLLLEEDDKLDEVYLSARAEPQEKPEDPCIQPPEARYRGAENQLYRVEIHQSGSAGEATFKWSRDNGSVVFPIRTLHDKRATLDHLGRDDRLDLEEGDWVEIVDDDYVLRGETRPLLEVVDVEQADLSVTLAEPGDESVPVPVDEDTLKHPLLRRWDHKAGDSDNGAPKITDQGTLRLEEDEWLTLEDGIQIKFEPQSEGEEEGPEYRSGDYWLIPARTATGDVEWPRASNGNGGPLSLPPHGVEHHYAPLALVRLTDNGIQVDDCRCIFPQLCRQTE